MADPTPSNPKAGHVPDTRLEHHGGVPTPTHPRGSTSREGEVPDSTLPAIKPLAREF